jgi:hypothetical protein
MKRTEVQLPDPLFDQLSGLARELQLSVPDLLRRAVEELVQQQMRPVPKEQSAWEFPEGRDLGQFLVPVGDWRLAANEPTP